MTQLWVIDIHKLVEPWHDRQSEACLLKQPMVDFSVGGWLH